MKINVLCSHPDITNSDILQALTSGTSKIKIELISDDLTTCMSCVLDNKEALDLIDRLKYAVDINKGDRKRFGYK